ncbi:TPA: DEAD/DEAH box helicase family protein [Legionella pneumophila]|uniref:DEAD/DEAH box helicase family protein n=1 Tax=Legionella pneumophila TaxID=446 RepID=UPI0010AAC6FC|nr:DEAD/DEAH box helicase family protein [Legionella pneumophila]TIG77494.1 type III restriction endonuclease subunit R [Legionella pneumophila]HAT8797582.1 type III restriction endonuclease subunit R [Legionella pneumophila]
MTKHGFHQELVLNRWIYRFFNGGCLAELKSRLSDNRHEGIEEDGQTKFFHELNRNLINVDLINNADLRRHDLNIVRHWQKITEKRNRLEGINLHLKYFQYLALLFTEIYLDWYFNHPEKLLNNLNFEVTNYNAHLNHVDQFQLYNLEELNKLAFWCATGSGKTLLLHVNIHQYLFYFQKGREDRFPDKIILLTPNNGLSNQHLEELTLSGFSACRLFNKNISDSSVFKCAIEILDINKLSDTMGDKTVAVEAFEGNNLLLVDEGHRGTSSVAGAWMNRRDTLCRGGFSFEYSATFGQAVAKGKTVNQAEIEIQKNISKRLFKTSDLKKLSNEQKKQLSLSNVDKLLARSMALREMYAKTVLFDYSYKFFYEDGYGKDSLILNLAKDDDEDLRRLYFTACLLSFYLQQYLWSQHKDRLAEFKIEKPLWVFVGNTVNSEDNDVLAVVKFLAWFISNEEKVKEWISDLLLGKARLLDTKGQNIFENRFIPLINCTEDRIYRDILKQLFNSESKKRLKLVNIKGSQGELALKVGDSHPFGIINIGDGTNFFKLSQDETEFDKEVDEFGGSLFNTLNVKDSNIHILIGSRKFTEGWSSWRVSTMGLLNMGRGEGSQIIQLFGRGVRLKGQDYSLKRSLQANRPKGLYLEKLETLNIFGVRADYMAAFKEYLQEEGITPTDEIIELNFNTRSNLPPGKIKTLALKDGYKDNQKNSFKYKYHPWLYEIPKEFAGKIKKIHVQLDLYPKLEALNSLSIDIPSSINSKEESKIDSSVMAMFDFDHIYLSLQDFKSKRDWSNLRLDREKLKSFCKDSNDWYTLLCPRSELEIRKIADVFKQEEILIQLLLDYTDRFYKSLKNAYEGSYYDVVKMKDDDEGMLKVYNFGIESTDEGNEYQTKIQELQQLISSGKLGETSKWNAPHMVAICFDRHLYYPLFSIEENKVPLTMRPTVFDSPSEVKFVRDLESFYNSSIGQMLIGHRSLYLLRNAANKSKGLGFAQAGNFYPDFLLWLIDDITGKQWLSLIDPKGIYHMSLNHPKFGLYKEVKEIQKQLADPNLILNAFILSVTKFSDLININDKLTQENLEDRHILFMDTSEQRYLVEMFERMR